ncbi:MAG: UDP-3-O-(3-hydroxymyristoyl)glucosamine N-acyltransferase [Lentisphaeraceae bacterium]|nr:UDP-3-O-(3-hydroxymyristoyl)glucosamine N-acyltransferase [Lentisphaeraceae bacterium]
MKLSEVVQAVNGTCEADGAIEIRAMASLLEARAGDISFLANQKYAPQMKETKASAVLVAQDYAGETAAALIRVEDPNKAFASLSPIFGPKPVVREPGIHATAVIGEGVTLGKDVYIGPYTVIEEGSTIGDGTIIDGMVFIAQHVQIGKQCHLYPQVNIRESCILGDRVILHAGVKIGTDGYGYTVEIGAQGPVINKVPQIGIVEIGNDVEIGSNTCVDRARFGRTRVGDCVKIDNLVQIGHNVQIAPFVGIIAQAGIAGSAKIETGALIWSQAGISGHLTVHERAQVAPQAGVKEDVPEGEYVAGTPAIPKRKFAETLLFPRLIDKLKKKVADLEAKVKALEAR